jgi:prepilin-type processing-associated H-X9-DG protein/prepilin-type N-terminal cleavage/methylation domain-containing protein
MDLGRRAFSLLELLVVAAIIALLTGLMLPALAGARETARKCECASNSRELVVAASVYAGDYRGLLPPGAPDFLQNLTRWHGSRDHPSEPFRPTGGSLSGYLGAEDASAADGIAPPVRRCPSFLPVLRQLAELGAGFELSSGGYGYNNAFVGVQRRRVARGVWVLATDRSGSLLAGFQNPAKTISFSDSAFASDQGIDGIIEYSFVEPRFWPDLPGSRADPSMHFRHQGRANVAWLDTHVSAEARTFSWSSGLFGVDAERVGIGFIGAADDNSLFGQDD